MNLPETIRSTESALARNALAQSRITRLAAMLPVHRAFHWLHLHQPQLRLWQMEMTAIAAPTFHEGARADWFLAHFRSLKLSNVHIDEEGNVTGELGAIQTPEAGFLLVSAHLDTVFAPGVNTQPTESLDNPVIFGPGICDNGAGLTALLALASALSYADIAPPMPILFCANVGEEGEGDLCGMRYLFERGPYAGRIRAAVALEGSGTATVVTRALGSRRLRVSISGPGGHSWTDAGRPNPIVLLSRGIAALDTQASGIPSDKDNRTTFSPGYISGGTSVNSIPEKASVLLDLRSTDASQLDHYSDLIAETFRSIVAEANGQSRDNAAGPVTWSSEQIGDRPTASLPQDSPILNSLHAVDRHLGLRTEFRLGSTDANLPMSLGVPAVAIAAGGTGGGIHTLGEWYDPTGREIALRRILLLLLDLAQTLA